MRGPVSKDLLAQLTGTCIQQLKGDTSVQHPTLIVAGNTWRLAQSLQSMRESSCKWAARLRLMNDADDGRLRPGAVHGQVAFEDGRCEAKHRELKIWISRR